MSLLLKFLCIKIIIHEKEKEIYIYFTKTLRKFYKAGGGAAAPFLFLRKNSRIRAAKEKGAYSLWKKQGTKSGPGSGTSSGRWLLTRGSFRKSPGWMWKWWTTTCTGSPGPVCSRQGWMPVWPRKAMCTGRYWKPGNAGSFTSPGKNWSARAVPISLTVRKKSNWPSHRGHRPGGKQPGTETAYPGK